MPGLLYAEPAARYSLTTLRLDTWWWQPWSWLWSDLERDRLGRWLGAIVVGTWACPWAIIGMTVFGAVDGRWVMTGWIMMVVSVLMALSIIQVGQVLHIRQAHRHGWYTLFWEPTSWAVRRLSERAVWGDPTHWAAIPHVERHTIEKRWSSPDAFVAARRQEWDALAVACQKLADDSVRGIGTVLLSHTFSTTGAVPQHWQHHGTPLDSLARREAGALSRTQRRMFGQVVSRSGPSVADPHVWYVTTLPLEIVPGQIAPDQSDV